MEDRLQNLLETNSETNRIRLAKEWKKQGKKIIGTMSSYVPEEIIMASGMLPFRITGSWEENIGHARIYRNENSCSYCNHVLESFMGGQMDFLDGVVTTDLDQDLLRLWDIIVATKSAPFSFVMHVPFVDSVLNYDYFVVELSRLKENIEKMAGHSISADNIRLAIREVNQTRGLLKQVYQMRKQEIPPLSGAEMLKLTTACAIMPKTEFNWELAELMPFLKARRTALKKSQPRLLVCGEMLDNPAYLQLVEEFALVAMDDLDTGSRYLNQNIDVAVQDPLYAIARGYLNSHGAPRMVAWDRQVDQIIAWVKEYRIDGVLSLPLTWCYPQKFRLPYLHQKLEEAGIPCISFDREYHLANLGQLRTRIGAFVEMLTA